MAGSRVRIPAPGKANTIELGTVALAHNGNVFVCQQLAAACSKCRTAADATTKGSITNYPSFGAHTSQGLASSFPVDKVGKARHRLAFGALEIDAALGLHARLLG